MLQLGAAQNLARFLSRDADVAEDIVQEAFLQAYRGFQGYRGGDPSAWVFAIVRNCHRTALAQRKRRAHVPMPDETGSELPAEDPDPETNAVNTSEARKLEAAITALPEEFREAFVLREMEELSYREIADTVGIPIGTVMSRLARARAMLREKWLGDDDMR